MTQQVKDLVSLQLCLRFDHMLHVRRKKKTLKMVKRVNFSYVYFTTIFLKSYRQNYYMTQQFHLKVNTQKK